MTVYIVIPTYEEVDVIEDTVKAVRDVLPDQPPPIIVDDGSIDGTSQVVTRLAKDGIINLTRHDHNQGVGAAFLTGFALALEQALDTDIVVLMEADGTSDPRLLPSLIEQIHNGADIAIASRFIRGGGLRNFSYHRTMLCKSCNFLMKLAFPSLPVADYTIFYRAYRAGALRAAISKLDPSMPTEFSFNAYLLLQFEPTVKIVEVPFLYDYGKKRSRSKMHTVPTVLSYTKILARQLLHKKS